MNTARTAIDRPFERGQRRFEIRYAEENGGSEPPLFSETELQLLQVEGTSVKFEKELQSKITEQANVKQHYPSKHTTVKILICRSNHSKIYITFGVLQNGGTIDLSQIIPQHEEDSLSLGEECEHFRQTFWKAG